MKLKDLTKAELEAMSYDDIAELILKETNRQMKINELFKEYDGMILPASGGIAPKFDDEIDRMSDRYLILENHMAIGNFGGYPSITIPSGFVDNMPVGINITGRVKEDDVVLNIANKIESTMEYKNQIAKEMK